MKAICLIRDQPCYRKDAFLAGLRAAGYEIVSNCSPEPGDLLVIWNRYGPYEHMAEAWEAKGGTTIVCENGYHGTDDKGIQYYAISKWLHNGAGNWPKRDDVSPDPWRWYALRTELAEWRTTGDHILVCGQRGIGSKLMASPPNWAEETAAKLMKLTDRPIRIRQHPGRDKSVTRPLADDLKNCWCCVIWSSGCGVDALIRGIPVIYQAPAWICQEAANSVLHIVNAPYLRKREPELARMAWAQFSINEITFGIPFELMKQVD